MEGNSFIRRGQIRLLLLAKRLLVFLRTGSLVFPALDSRGFKGCIGSGFSVYWIFGFSDNWTGLSGSWIRFSGIGFGLSDIWMMFPSEKLTFHLARRLLKLYGFLFILKSFKTRYRIALTAMIKELFNHIY